MHNELDERHLQQMKSPAMKPGFSDYGHV